MVLDPPKIRRSILENIPNASMGNSGPRPLQHAIMSFGILARGLWELAWASQKCIPRTSGRAYEAHYWKPTLALASALASQSFQLHFKVLPDFLQTVF